MQNFDWNDILKAVAVIASLCALLAALWKGVEALRKLLRTEEKAAAEAAQNAKISELEIRVTRCEERLERGDKQFSNSREDMTQVLTILSAMMMHFISGNDHKKLTEVKNELDQYMARR